ERYQKIIAPAVRMSCHLEVGSGTVVYSELEEGLFKTYVLTALHVVSGAREGRPIQISVFDRDNEATRDFEGNLVDFSEKLDVAVVEIKSNASFHPAKIADKEKINDTQRFDDIYAVGCPLGYSPIQTEGEITTKNKILGGENYWMISAQTIFGNSGGGIFLKENNEMIGILTRVSAYNNFINIAVPHMGIVVSGDRIHEWFEQSNLQFLYNESISRQECFRRREGQNRQIQGHQPEINDPTSVRNVLR
ncbi:MAG: serine protease, partial [Nanoarchaeota archaeon]